MLTFSAPKQPEPMPKTNPHQVLWAALLKIYGSQQAAEQAARDNPQILNPSYSFCNTMLASADVLNNMMSKEEARSGHGAPILATDERCGALPRSPWRTTPWHPLHRPVPLHPLQLSSPAALFSCSSLLLPTAGDGGDDEQPCGAAVRPGPRHSRSRAR